jgi:hypothetical protein
MIKYAILNNKNHFKTVIFVLSVQSKGFLSRRETVRSSIPDFFSTKKFPIMLFYLFIFAVIVKCILTCSISLDSEK